MKQVEENGQSCAVGYQNMNAKKTSIIFLWIQSNKTTFEAKWRVLGLQAMKRTNWTNVISTFITHKGKIDYVDTNDKLETVVATKLAFSVGHFVMVHTITPTLATLASKQNVNKPNCS